jgi:hypothetical protein
MRKNPFQRLLRLVIVALAILILALFTNAAAAGAAVATTASTFTPSADAYVDQSHPWANFGRNSLMSGTNPQMRAYLRFDVKGLSGAVAKVTLRIYAMSSSNSGFEVHSVANNNWDEYAINYRNAPSVSSNVVATSGAVSAGNWVSVDVTSLVGGSGTVSIALAAAGRGQVTYASRESGATSPQLLIQSSVAPQTSLLWSGDAETGDLSQWYLPDVINGPNTGGGVYDSGIAGSSVSTDFAHSGRYSVKMTVTTPNDPSSGTRLFRWLESRNYPQAYYSAWLYFPQSYTPTTYWNIVQFKSKNATNNDPFWILNIGNRPANGNMYFYLYYWQSGTGPTVNETGPVSYDQALKDVPVGKWVHVEVYLKEASDFSGRVTVWQDGTAIFDKSGVKTKYSDGDNQWSVNNYSSGLTPATSAIYADDAAISTAYIP